MYKVTPENFNVVKKQVALKILLTSMIFFFSVLALLNILEGDYSHLPIDVILVLIFLGLVKLSRKEKYTELSLGIFISSLAITMIYLFFDGGMNSTGPIYSIIFPIPTIFLYGEKKGGILAFLGATSQIIMFIFFDGAGWFPVYDTELLTRFLIVYVAVALFSYAFVIAMNTLHKSFTANYNSLKETTEEYKELAITREKFISMFSHDFKGHIGTLLNMVQLLRMRFDIWDNEKKLHMISAIEELADKNLTFCNSLLAWTLVKGSRMELQRFSYNINDTINQALDVLQERINEKKITVNHNKKHISQYMYDNDMIGSVLRNLISNSIKFSYEGNQIHIMAEEIDEGLKVSVSDNGIGISKQVGERLFRLDKYYSGKGTANEKGTGMGLILCKEFVEKHEGTINFHSSEGSGTTFTFTIPNKYRVASLN